MHAESQTRRVVKLTGFRKLIQNFRVFRKKVNAEPNHLWSEARKTTERQGMCIESDVGLLEDPVNVVVI